MDISRLASPLIWVRIIATLLITPLITTHESPSSEHAQKMIMLSISLQCDYLHLCG